MSVDINLRLLGVLTAALCAACTTTQEQHSEVVTYSEFKFRGKTFGSPPTALMSRIREFRNSPFFSNNAVTEYTDITDELRIGDRTLDTISYIYLEDQLFRIVVEFKNDRVCSAARGTLTAVEAQYNVNMKRYTQPTKPELFLAKAERGNVRIVSMCSLNSGKWDSSLSFDYMPSYNAADRADKEAEARAQLQRTQRERSGL